MRFKAISIAVVLVLVIVAAGCGSKKKAASATGGATTTTATTTASSSGGGGGGGTSTSSKSSGGAASFASAKNCLQLAGVGQKFSQAMAAASGSGKTDLNAVADAYKAMADAAPEAIRSDFQTIAAAFGTYTAALKKAGYTPGKVPTAAQMASLATAAKSFSDPKLQTAEQHLSAWATQNCHG